MFDELGDAGLVNVIELICRGEYGETGLVPYPTKGKDKGIDGKHVAAETGKPHIQSKWREVAGYDDRPLRREALKTFEGELAKARTEGRSGKFIYVTNVRRTAGDITKSETTMAAYAEFDIEYWDFRKLSHFMDVYEEIQNKMLPLYSARQLRRKKEEQNEREAEQAKREAELDKKAKELLRRSPDFQAAALKLKHLYIDWKLLADQYLGFLYLVEPIYVDDQDHVREIIRDLFGIDGPAERKIIDQLQHDGRIDITGNVITVIDAKAAAAGTALVVQHMGTDLEKIITLIQGA
jgi:hypothetical protein